MSYTHVKLEFILSAFADLPKKSIKHLIYFPPPVSDFVFWTFSFRTKKLKETFHSLISSIFIFFDLCKNLWKNSDWKNISDVSCDVAGQCSIQKIVPHSRHYGAVHNENPFIVYFEIQKDGQITRTFEETFEVSEILLNGFCSINDRGIAAK